MPTVSTSVIVVICLIDLTQASNLPSAIFNSDHKKNWAVLVAGSDGWSNYRHQSDVCHAYQILAGLGIPKENIITFMYDDIANNEENPFPGKIFNDYNHRDVYADVQIDYKGSDVNPEMFTRVMKGDKELKAAGRKVLDSGPQDNVFVYFSDHGARDLICFPEGDVSLHPTRLGNKKWCLRVLYVFIKFSAKLYATTAAKPSESSWAAFCWDETIDTCLADEYSYNWMIDTETTMGKLTLDKFQAHHMKEDKAFTDSEHSTVADSRPSSQAHIVGLMRRVMGATTEEKYESAKRRLHRALQMGTIVKHTFDDFITRVEKRCQPSGKQMNMLEQLKCFEAVFDVFKRHCFTIQQVPEVAQHVSKLHQLCGEGYQPEDLIDAVMNVCT
ncbi:hypothetical protein EG68_07536 [Paragonimus skrjabini miyazakii]|uniref:Legumain prodomain domain-containing protein n=1 Tax=Paragonimus skrjabini miyazakii TaxID=59628 RepID=A0A8S9YQU1_9TREM|nr:hypothetical protein EG68_07536 [Paragonimus skrjabini miyazakii]